MAKPAMKKTKPVAPIIEVRPEPALKSTPVQTAQVSRQQLMQINFQMTVAGTRIVSELAREYGSTRRLFAKLLRDAGHDMPDEDVNAPLAPKRRMF